MLKREKSDLLLTVDSGILTAFAFPVPGDSRALQGSLEFVFRRSYGQNRTG